MINVSKNTREETENQFMALLLNKNELLDITQIRPEWLSNENNKKMLKQILDCYKEHGILNMTKLTETHRDFNFYWWSQLFNETFYYDSAWKEQLKIMEDNIINFYKQDIIHILIDELNKGKITHAEYIKRIRKLDDVQLIDSVQTLNQQEILENISIENSLIKLNGFYKFNNFLKLVHGDFMIIGAKTGQGKSGFMMNLLNDLMDRYQCIYFNMEMSKNTIYKRLISIKGNVLIDNINNPSKLEQERIAKALKEIEEAKIIIEHKTNDVKQIKATVMKLKDKNKHTVLFVDHLGLTRCEDKKNIYEQATEVAKQLRQICLEYDCTIISASQLNRSAYGSEELSLNMLKDSGELENSASKVVLLYKTDKSNNSNYVDNMKIDIVKNRDGICAYVPMEYNKRTQTFKEIED